MKWLGLVAEAINRLPLEKLIIRTPDHTKDREDLRDIMKSAASNKLNTGAEPASEVEEVPTPQSKSHFRKHTPAETTNDQTVDYQNREIGKLLLRMERHYAQRLRINGVPCDCGAQKHLLDLESLCEETVPMVESPEIYYHIVEWVREIGPKSTQEAATSGQFDEEYPIFSHQARDYRKAVMGTLDVKILWPKKDLPAREEISALPPSTEGERQNATWEANEALERQLDQVDEDTGVVSRR